jgi:hypothetical protein
MRFTLPWGGYVDVPKPQIGRTPSVQQCFPLGRFLRKLLNPFETIDEACESCTCLSTNAGGGTSSEGEEVLSVIEIWRSCRGKEVYIHTKEEHAGGTYTYTQHGPFPLNTLNDLVQITPFNGLKGFYYCVQT